MGEIYRPSSFLKQSRMAGFNGLGHFTIYSTPGIHADAILPECFTTGAELMI